MPLVVHLLKSGAPSAKRITNFQGNKIIHIAEKWVFFKKSQSIKQMRIFFSIVLNFPTFKSSLPCWKRKVV